jgi:hypothetical protein
MVHEKPFDLQQVTCDTASSNLIDTSTGVIQVVGKIVKENIDTAKNPKQDRAFQGRAGLVRHCGQHRNTIAQQGQHGQGCQDEKVRWRQAESFIANALGTSRHEIFQHISTGSQQDLSNQ